MEQVYICMCLYIYFVVGELLMGFRDVAFLPCRSTFYTTFKKIMVELEAIGSSHVLEMWLEVSNGILPVKYFCSNNASFLSWRS